MFQSDDADTFFQGSLISRAFVNTVLRKGLFTRIPKQLAPLGPGQGYVPVSLPAQGGLHGARELRDRKEREVVALYLQVRCAEMQPKAI